MKQTIIAAIFCCFCLSGCYQSYDSSECESNLEWTKLTSPCDTTYMYRGNIAYQAVTTQSCKIDTLNDLTSKNTHLQFPTYTINCFKSSSLHALFENPQSLKKFSEREIELLTQGYVVYKERRNYETSFDNGIDYYYDTFNLINGQIKVNKAKNSLPTVFFMLIGLLIIFTILFHFSLLYITRILNKYTKDIECAIIAVGAIGSLAVVVIVVVFLLIFGLGQIIPFLSIYFWINKYTVLMFVVFIFYCLLRTYLSKRENMKNSKTFYPK